MFITYEYECGDGCGTTWNWAKGTKYYTDKELLLRDLQLMRNSPRHKVLVYRL